MISHLFIDRMLVYQASSILYDECFHHGVNIIHGDNGSGKSTLADFIFFGLGGDLRQWKPYASRADAVMIQITIPAGVITTRRFVSTEAFRPMDLFFGGMDEAIQAGDDRWQTLPYSRQEHGLNFSQVLFKAIGLPEAISDGASNLSMHQILRLLYVDQLTPIQRIFRVESWDTWQTKQAIGDLLCGIGGYELYDCQIALRETEKKYSTASTMLTNLMAVASGYGEQILVEHIEAAIQNQLSQRLGLLQSIEALWLDDSDEDADGSLKLARAEALKVYRTSRQDVGAFIDRIETLEYEIEDARAFLDHLRHSVREFDDAAATFMALGRLNFEFCPSCFAPVKSKAEGHCQLCDVPHVAGKHDSRTLAVKLDLQMQLRESEALQEGRKADLSQMTANLRIARVTLRRATASVELSRSGPVSKREGAVAELSRKVGFLDSQLEVLQKRLELGRRITAASKEKEEFNSKITEFRSAIGAITRSQDKRKRVAYTLISNEAKELLESDMQEQSDFEKIDYVDFNFAEDWIAINDKKNRAGSASGMVILKNSFAAAMLFSSLKDKSFCLPRWMLFDNIEDKGMIQERSWNFQRLLVEKSKMTKTSHQIIFTTSKIAPELKDSPAVVGGEYTKQRPALAIVASIPR
ncbi:MAG: AAA family ATPase [Janthinobacterium lividum]